MRMRLLSALICGSLGLSTSAVAGTIPGDLALTPAVTGVAQPIAIRNAGDGSGRLFIVGRAGLISIKPAASSTILATPFLNITSLVAMNDEGGLLGLAFDPDFANNRRFYVSYSDTNVDKVIARYTASTGNPNVADPGSATILLRIDQGTGYHQGGDIHFGHDGYLYIAVGDGAEGGSNDACNRAQSLTPQDVANNNGSPGCAGDGGFAGNTNSRALMGKILRIDVSTTTPAGANELCASSANGSAPYAIPAANPFAGTNGGAGRCDEIFAYGMRNPFRFSVDRGTGDLFIGDVGESEMEEVDFIAAASPGGINFGWPMCEGTVPVPGEVGGCGSSTAPILTVDRSLTDPCYSITGGYRYRGAIAGLQGTYVFSDYCSGRIRFGEQVGNSWSWTQWQNGPDIQHSTFGEDEDGELYIAEIDSDRALRFSSSQVGPVVQIFQDGFEN